MQTASTDDWYDSFSGAVYGVSLSPSMKSGATFEKRGGSVTAIAIGPLASLLVHHRMVPVNRKILDRSYL